MAALAGLAGGMALGLAARLGRFCVMGAIEDAALGGDTGRLRMLLLAGAAAIGLTALLATAEMVDPAATLYLRLPWSPLGAVLGGLMFGFGMAQVGTCGFGALARAGSGDLRSVFVVIVVGIFGYAVLVGPLAGLRLALVPPEGAAPQAMSAWLGARLGLGPLLPALAIAGGLAAAALLQARGALAPRQAALGLGVGATVALAWAATAHAGRDGFDMVAVEGFSFVAPLGETLHLAMAGDAAGVLDFSVAAVLGVVLGSALGSAIRGEFHWEACDDARELRRQLLGAALMGVGGVLALGCSIGQGLSALSVLSPSAPVVMAAIFVGARIGLYLLVERTTRVS
ncbi:YeeE/YedE family protein [Paralimibaculum aggregatum]|uniref:YeeE/YedE family protein n=1 Tax=Paralimibaculum aggregatum TaxID=3036245 RepID=A0ABQ6LG68_9RHOB|nr:YeeE/YedE family protein [Limibaculum sp. NKW23]GMG81987.1 YeeE/YedE family protein [Limibaculum sp. NKW23]